MAFTLIYQGLEPISTVEERVSAIGTHLKSMFDESDRTGSSPLDAARSQAERILQRGPRDPDVSTFGDIRGRFSR